jgi:hypothetical protein
LAESMSFLTDSKLHASSVYGLQDKVILVSKSGGSEREVFMTSMLKLIHDFKIIRENRPHKWLFNSSQVYDSLISLLEAFPTWCLVECPLKRKVLHSVNIPRNHLSGGIGLTSLVRRKWFMDSSVLGSTYAHELSWESYKRDLPWLGDTPEETLLSSPFSNHMALANFIRSLEPSQRALKIIGPARPQVSVLDTIRSIIEYCQWPRYKLSGHISKTRVGTPDLVKELAVRLWRLKEMPPLRNKTETATDVLKNMPDIMEKEYSDQDLLVLSKQERALLVLQRFSKGYDTTLDDIRRAKVGVIGAFTKRQEIKKGLYVGHGTYCGQADDIPFQLEILDQRVTRIDLLDKLHIRSCSNSIRELMRSMNLSYEEPTEPTLSWDVEHDSWTSTGTKSCCRMNIVTSINSPMEHVKCKIEMTNWGSLRLVTKTDRLCTLISVNPRGRAVVSETYEQDRDVTPDASVNDWLAGRESDPKIAFGICCDNKTFEWAISSLRFRAWGLRLRSSLRGIKSIADKEEHETRDAGTENTIKTLLNMEMTFDASMFSDFEDFGYDSQDDLSDLEEIDDNAAISGVSGDISSVTVSEWDDAGAYMVSEEFREEMQPHLSQTSCVSNRFFDGMIRLMNSKIGPAIMERFYASDKLALSDFVKLKNECYKDEGFSFME